MTIAIRRLGPGDEALLARLAVEDADFDLEGREEQPEPGVPLAPAVATAYLANPAVLFWVAFDGDQPVGFLYCLQVPLRSGIGLELLLYEVGVHKAWRRRGVGRALNDGMSAWMAEHGVEDVWVLADNPGAVAYYHACGFEIEKPEPTYMIRSASDGVP